MRASAIIIKKERVLLIHRRKEGSEYWVFPSGGIEEHETKEEAVRREVLEETNLKVTKCEYSFDYVDERNVKNRVFVCSVEKGKPKLGRPEALKHSEQNWYHPEWVDIKDSIELNIFPDEGKKVLESYLK